MLAKWRQWIAQMDACFDELTRREQMLVGIGAGLIGMVCLGLPMSVLALIRLLGLGAIGILVYVVSRLHEDDEHDW